VRRGKDGKLVHSHGGSVRGFICEMRRFPANDACLVVLCNRDDAPLHAAADRIEAVLFGRDR
jgi:hypothetical protein